ncbi:Hypothetical protein CINCED_3A025819 [Cinara cedri]|uniref:Uncharacterized protein n=1 Tax=Cinara cedri TaxID=506608 RepID=A0A5E4M5D3_9HEMI|nr:Hypothetical protein CINCED_3A025819 [Cinara cedri]
MSPTKRSAVANPNDDPPDAIQIESPLTNVPTMGDDQQVSSAGEPPVPSAEQQQDGQAKGPLTGLIPGGSTTTAPAASAGSGSGSPLPDGLLGGGGLPTGIPGLPGGLSGAGGDGQNAPTLILGGFSVLVMPLRGMSLSNMASMMSNGQQMMQLLPKPGVG